jgi:hypothetical protein
MRLFKGVLFFMFLFVMPAFSFAAEEEIFTTSYECFDQKGCLRWQAIAEIYSSPEKGDDMNMLVEKGSGIYGLFKNRISWQSELQYLKKEGQIKPIRNHTNIFNASGELICIEDEEFDYGNNIITFTRDDKKTGKSSKNVFKIKEDIVNRLVLALYIQQFLKSGKKEAEVQMLSNEPKLIDFRLYIAGTEEIESAGEKKQAYKLCLDPQLGLLSFVKLIIPKAYVWHSAKDDFEWLQYKGLEVNLSSPIVEIKKPEDKS